MDSTNKGARPNPCWRTSSSRVPLEY